MAHGDAAGLDKSPGTPAAAPDSPGGEATGLPRGLATAVRLPWRTGRWRTALIRRARTFH